MTIFFLRFLRFFAALIFCVASVGVNAQEDGIPFPKPTEAFKPKVTYEMDIAKAWKVVTMAINENQIPIDSASKDANQISTGYRIGPSDGDGLMFGKLVSQYKYVVSFIPISSSKTQIKVSASIQARRLAAKLTLRGNNALSDVSWVDATADNPDDVKSLQNWLYEQIEQKEGSMASTASVQRDAVPTATQPNFAPSTSGSLDDQLEKLKVMRAKKLITEAEYKAMRAKALGL